MVHLHRVVVKRGINSDHLPADRRIQVRNGFDRFDRTEGIALLHHEADRRQFDKHHISKFTLCPVGNAYRGDFAFHA